MKVLSYNRITDRHKKEHIEQEFNPYTIIPIIVEDIEIKKQKNTEE